MLRHRVRELRLAMAVVEAGAVFVSAALAAAARFPSLEQAAAVLQAQLGPHLFWVTWLVPAAWVVLLDGFGLYHLRRLWAAREEALLVLRAWLLLGAGLAAFLVLAKVDVSRLFLAYFLSFLLLLTLALRLALRAGFSFLRRRGRNRRYLLLVGGGGRGRRLLQGLRRHPELGIQAVGYLDDDPSPEMAVDGLPRLGPVAALEEVLHSRVVDEVAVCLPLSALDKLNRVIEVCEAEGKQVRLPVDFWPTRVFKGRLAEFEGVPLLTLSCGPDRELAVAAKRLFDLAFSGLALALTSPLFLLIALAVKLDSPGPVFYAQERVGLHGRRFKLYKFRTMVKDADKLLPQLLAANEADGPVFKIKNDPRVTRVGRVLRRTSLDELPQFINVLKGDMSVVGPRPPLPHEVDQYNGAWRRRLSVKPGITCIWQATARSHASFEEWVKMDLEYIDRWSLWLDIKLVARTALAVVARTGQ